MKKTEEKRLGYLKFFLMIILVSIIQTFPLLNHELIVDHKLTVNETLTTVLLMSIPLLLSLLTACVVMMHFGFVKQSFWSPFAVYVLNNCIFTYFYPNTEGYKVIFLSMIVSTGLSYILLLIIYFFREK